MSARSYIHLFYLEDAPRGELTSRIRQMLVDAILSGRHPVDVALPSSRNLAEQLGVARTTVTSVYALLVGEGMIVSKERSGYYINPDIIPTNDSFPASAHKDKQINNAPNWARRFLVKTSEQKNICKPSDWQSYPYPFICGQIDLDYFPVREWRECSRNSLSLDSVKKWASDSIAKDDPELVEQVRTRLLPRRGVSAAADEILITVGSQNALYMAARLLIDKSTSVALESPGYPDARNLFQLHTDKIKYIPVDGRGITLTNELASCDYAYVTPSHQVPTTVTMPLSRRKRLLDFANEFNFIIFEDDYENEVNFDSTALPALKSMDRNNRVIYFSSLSKTLAPGLRMGFLVGPKDLIQEVRALRRLMLRHAPTDTQRTLSLFLAQGSYDTLIGKLRRTYEERWRTLLVAIDRHLPNCQPISVRGGSSVWLKGPKGLDAEKLANLAKEEGVLIEPGDIYFPDCIEPCPWFRMGFSAIGETKIDAGVKILGALTEQAMATPPPQKIRFC